MPVIVNNRLAPASAGADLPTGAVLIAGHFTTTTDVVPKGPLRSIQDLETAYGLTRSTFITPALWDYLDYAFKQGLQKAYVANYGGADTIDTALALFDQSFGQCQVVAVAETINSALHAKLATHANTYGRFAVADVVSGSSLTTMQTLGDGLPTDVSADKIALYGPWISVAPPTGVTGGAERLIPASAAAVAIMSRVDKDGNPNRAPGGPDYFLDQADSIAILATEAQRDTAVTHKLNLIRLVDGVLQIDSARTALVKDPSTPFWQVNCSRTRMWASYYSARAARKYYLKPLDAEGHTAGALKKDIAGILGDLFDRDALYGVNPSDAYDVNVGAAVNTTLSAAQAILNVVAQMKLDLYIETVEVDLVTVPVAGNVIPS